MLPSRFRDLDSLGSAIIRLNLDSNLETQISKQGLGSLGEGSLDCPTLRTPAHLESSQGTRGDNLLSLLGLQILCNGNRCHSMRTRGSSPKDWKGL